MKLKLNLFIRNHKNLTEESNLKIWTNESKKIMEFANLLIKLYGEKHGVTSEWFSDNARFNQ